MTHAQSPPPSQVEGFIDRFTVFRGSVSLTGWCFSTQEPLETLALQPAEWPARGREIRFRPNWSPSPDVAAVYGPAAARCRFDAAIDFGLHNGNACGGMFAAVAANGAAMPVCRLGSYRISAASDITQQFFKTLAATRNAKVLEIGSRARSGVTRREHVPADGSYVGCDIVAGPNVDIVCDAHRLSHSLPVAHFNVVFAISVIEHLLMPWKFVIEANRVMAPGAIGYFATHQCWPLHDAPWDFWRFSDRAWHGLLNPATGFEILDAAMGEPAYVIAADCHPATNFGPEPSGFLSSNVLFRKIGETNLSWDVDLAGLVQAAYPA